MSQWTDVYALYFYATHRKKERKLKPKAPILPTRTIIIMNNKKQLKRSLKSDFEIHIYAQNTQA